LGDCSGQKSIGRTPLLLPNQQRQSADGGSDVEHDCVCVMNSVKNRGTDKFSTTDAAWDNALCRCCNGVREKSNVTV